MNTIFDGLYEEEVEILEVFCFEMNQYGHKGYYSFYDNIPNGYFIYKEDSNWVLVFNEKGKATKEKKYTNIYNLCLDVLNELKIDDFDYNNRDLVIPRGTRVIITKSTDCPIDEINQGIIINSSINKKDNSQPERTYRVLGDDGKIYDGLYGLKLYGDICFRTMEDFIKDSEKDMVDNTDNIHYLVDRNWELYWTIQEVKGEKDRYLGEKILRK